jgi:hypothetical protein
MVTIGDKIKEILEINEEVNKYMEYNQIGSFLNFIREAIKEINDKDVLEKSQSDYIPYIY